MADVTKETLTCFGNLSPIIGKCATCVKSGETQKNFGQNSPDIFP